MSRVTTRSGAISANPAFRRWRYLREQMRYIVGLELRIEKLEGRCKLGQNRMGPTAKVCAQD
ncbi:MAG: hypothetical protein C4338_02665 [Rhodanobacteraceae bacterium]